MPVFGLERQLKKIQLVAEAGKLGFLVAESRLRELYFVAGKMSVGKNSG